MFELSHYFRVRNGYGAAVLPFALDAVLDDWESLRAPLLKNRPDAFSRSEWAYLVSGLSRDALESYFGEAFGPQLKCKQPRLRRLFRPRGTVAVWLPNNVSLLGPLITIALTLTGNRIWLKGGSSATGLTKPFLDAVLAALRPGPLREVLESRVTHDTFERTDARNREWSRSADVRIVFGSDQAATDIHAHAGARGTSISFTDKRSVVWIEPGAETDSSLAALLKVFAIYGTAGCTSPQKIVMLGASERDTAALSKRLIALWALTIRHKPAMHVASANVLTWQSALAAGWDASLTEHNHAVIATGCDSLPPVQGPMFLPIVATTLDEAIARLPSNVQTLGYIVREPAKPIWTKVIANTAIKRFVPVDRMHHFNTVWDGRNFWKECFEEVEVQV